MRDLNESDKEVSDKIYELQLFVSDKIKEGSLSDSNKAGALISDIQLINHIWKKDKGTM